MLGENGSGHENERSYFLAVAAGIPLGAPVTLIQRYFAINQRSKKLIRFFLNPKTDQYFVTVGETTKRVPKWVYEKVVNQRGYLRLRRVIGNDPDFWLSLKKRTFESEWGMKLDEGTFDSLWPLGSKLEVVKTRYEIPYPVVVPVKRRKKGKKAEEVFEGKIEVDIISLGNGIMLCKIDFEHRLKRVVRAFRPPVWAKGWVEVTDMEDFRSTRRLIQMFKRGRLKPALEKLFRSIGPLDELLRAKS